MRNCLFILYRKNCTKVLKIVEIKFFVTEYNVFVFVFSEKYYIFVKNLFLKN